MKKCCDMRGMLSFLILYMLSKKEMNGQQIADELEKRKGCRPSPGTVYPALKALKESELIIERKEGKTISYGLTVQGKKVFEEAKTQFCKTFVGIR